MSLPSRVRPPDVVGLCLIVVSLGVPSARIVELLRGPGFEHDDRLALGCTLLRAGLAVLGVGVAVLGRLPIWQGNSTRRLSTRPRASAATTTFEILAIGIILVTATVLRLYELGVGLWLDEILTNVSYARMSFGEIVTTYDSQNQHLLFSLLAQAAFRVFGESPWALRLPAAIFGVASIWAMYLFAREVSGPRVALLASGLLTVSYHHIWFSQNARGYSGLLFWTLFASWLLVRAMREGWLSLWLLYAVPAALGVYTHMTLLFVLAGHGLSILARLLAARPVREPRRLLGPCLGFGLTGLLIFVLHAPVLPQMLAGEGIHEVSTVPAWKSPVWTLFELLRGLQLSFAGALVAIAASLIFGAGLVVYRREEPIVLELLLVPSLLCAAVVVGLGHHLWPRFFFFAMGFAALVVVRGAIVAGSAMALAADHLWGRARVSGLFTRPAIETAFGVALLLASLPAVPLAYRPKQDFVGALTFVEAHRAPDDAVAVAGLAAIPYRQLYLTDWEEVGSSQALEMIRARGQPTWFVYTLPTHMEAVHQDLLDDVRARFSLVGRFDGTVGDGAIYVYRADGTGPSSGLHRADAATP